MTPNSPQNLEGKLLLADPSLREANFFKSVILLAEHSHDEGAFGLVLNHPSGKHVGEILTDPEFAPLAKVRVFDGGPVGRDHLTFAAFWQKDQKLAFATRMSAEQAVKYSQRPNTMVHAFIGYSGWSQGQLEEELENQAWHPVQAPRTLLSQPHDITLWSEALRRISPFHHILTLAPENLLAN